MENRKVLVVDDDPSVRHLLERILGQEHWQVLTAPDGRTALQTAARSKPDVVVLDACMPGIDGFEVCRRMREDWRMRLIPVLFLTGLSGQESAIEGYDSGADAFLCKPFDGQELRARLDSMFRRSRQVLEANPLTGLPGSPSLRQEMERRLTLGQDVALMHADIDNFKAFNDARGFAAGDEALRATAGALQSQAPKGTFIAHIGGDDFAALCPESEARAAAVGLCAAFDGLPGALSCLTLSVGVAKSSPLHAPAYASLAAIASELKVRCKAVKGPGSRWVW